jgi:cytochrome c
MSIRTLCHLACLACLALLNWSAQAATATGDAVAGQQAFHPCASCHQLGDGRGGGFGPALDGVIGRRAGSVAGFAYSPAMRQSGVVWTEQRLAAFIQSPDKVVPGTRMRFFSWGYDERMIADLLAYLRQFPAKP